MTRTTAGLRALSDAVQALDLEHAFRVGADGTVTDAPTDDRRFWTPDVLHDETEDVIVQGDADDVPGWRTLSNSMSGQYGYQGPALHPSEVMSPSIADRIAWYADNAREDGEVATFVLVEVTDPSDADHQGDPIGWVVLYRTDPAS